MGDEWVRLIYTDEAAFMEDYWATVEAALSLRGDRDRLLVTAARHPSVRRVRAIGDGEGPQAGASGG